MKKILALLLAFTLCVAMAACGGADTPETTPTTQPDPNTLFRNFAEQAAQWDLAITYARVVEREDGTAFLMTDIVNQSQTIVQSADVYFAAYDQEGNPVPLINNTSEEFVKAAKLPDLYIGPEESWQANMGLRLTEGFEEIAYVVAIVDKYIDLEQNSVSNPLVDTWMDYYNGVVLEEYMLLALQANDPSGHYREFLAQVAEEAVVAVEARAVHEETYSTLLADITNNDPQATITGATLLFAGFDAQGNPVQLMTSATEDAYVKRLELSELSIAPGETWQADLGLRLSTTADQIVYVYVLAESWTTEEGIQENGATDRWLEYFNETTLTSFMMGK